jgi:arylsulfatase A-like enzyme
MPESMAFWKTEDSAEWRGPYYGFESVDFVLGEGEFSVIAGHYAEWLRTHHPQAPPLYTSQAALEPPPPDFFEVWKSAVPAEIHYNTWIADQAVAFIEATSREQPFFLYVSFPDPHHPFTPPRPYCEHYDPNTIPLPKVRPWT